MPASDVLLPFVQELKQLKKQLTEKKEPTRLALNELARAGCDPDDSIEEQCEYLAKVGKHLSLDAITGPMDGALPIDKVGWNLLRIAIGEPEKLKSTLEGFRSVRQRSNAVRSLQRNLEQLHDQAGDVGECEFVSLMARFNIDEKQLWEHYDNGFDFGDIRQTVERYLDRRYGMQEHYFPSPAGTLRICRVDWDKPHNGKPEWLQFATVWCTAFYPNDFTPEAVYDWLRREAYELDMQKEMFKAAVEIHTTCILADCGVLRNHAERLGHQVIFLLLTDYLEHGSIRIPPKMSNTETLDQYVTLEMASALVNRTKRTLERWIEADQNAPLPDIQGGGGKPNEWKWSTIRSWLEKKAGRALPVIFPTLR